MKTAKRRNDLPNSSLAKTMKVPNPFSRPDDGHKGTFGKIGILAGSRQMPGAAALSASASLRSGAGTVTVLCPRSAAASISSVNPCVMTIGFDEDQNGRLHYLAKKRILDSIATFDCLAIGPGLGQSIALQSILKSVLTHFDGPMIIDADGLNVFARLLATGQIDVPQPRNFFLEESFQETTEPSPFSVSLPLGRVFLTPHPGELNRLWNGMREAGMVEEWKGDEKESPAGSPATNCIRESQESKAQLISQVLGCCVLLKGPNSLITGPSFGENGRDLVKSDPHEDFGDCSEFFFAHNSTGNSGMATAGSGDVLTGTLAGFLGYQPASPATLALACHVHGLAGDLAAKKLGKTSLIATDIIEFLPAAISKAQND